MFLFKKFQKEDLARLALCTGGILGWATGLGKTIAMFVWPLLKCGFIRPSQFAPLRPAKPVLLVVPADGHGQTDDESMQHFKTKAVRLESQADFIRLSKPDPRTGRRTLPPHYYMTSYQQLAQNGVKKFPELDRTNPGRMMDLFHLKEADVIDWHTNRGEHYARHYEWLGVTIHSTWKQLEKAYADRRRDVQDNNLLARLSDSFHTLKQITPSNGVGYAALTEDQKRYLRCDLVISTHREF